MPTYDFRCEAGHVFEGYLPLRATENPPCGECGKPVERLISTNRHIPASAYPYVTKNIHKDGKAIEVRSPSHEAELCKIHGVRKRDDAAFLTQEYLGVDFRTGKQIYRERSGVGEKGCWV